MSAKGKATPFTDEELEALFRDQDMVELYAEERPLRKRASELLRWQATLRQAEAALAEMREERDAYRCVLNLIVGDDEELALIAKSHRHWAKSDALGEGFHVERAEALEALPQPSGNSGELAEVTP